MATETEKILIDLTSRYVVELKRARAQVCAQITALRAQIEGIDALIDKAALAGVETPEGGDGVDE